MKNYNIKLEITMDVLVTGAKDEEEAQELAMNADLSKASIVGTASCREITTAAALDSCARHNEETIEA